MKEITEVTDYQIKDFRFLIYLGLVVNIICLFVIDSNNALEQYKNDIYLPRFILFLVFLLSLIITFIDYIKNEKILGAVYLVLLSSCAIFLFIIEYMSGGVLSTYHHGIWEIQGIALFLVFARSWIHIISVILSTSIYIILALLYYDTGVHEINTLVDTMIFATIFLYLAHRNFRYNLILEKRLRKRKREIFNKKFERDTIIHEITSPLTIILHKAKNMYISNNSDIISEDLIALIRSASLMDIIISTAIETPEAKKRFEYSMLEGTTVARVLEDVVATAVVDSSRIDYSTDKIGMIKLSVCHYRAVQSISNIIRNGIKYSKDNTLFITMGISEDNKDVFYFEFNNKLKENQDKDSFQNLFSKYYRGNTEVKGKGIGLAIAKNFTQKMGGRLDYKIVDDEITFRLEYPIKQAILKESVNVKD